MIKPVPLALAKTLLCGYGRRHQTDKLHKPKVSEYDASCHWAGASIKSTVRKTEKRDRQFGRGFPKETIVSVGGKI